MAINKKLKVDSSSGLNITPDSYVGILSGVVHLGQQKNEYKGVKSVVDRIFLQFELQDLLTDKGTPVIFGKCVRNSMHKKAGLIEMASALGVDTEEGVDFEELVGKHVLLNIGPGLETDKIGIRGYSKVPSVLRNTLKPLTNTPRLYLDVEKITESQLSELPEWVRKMINDRVRENAPSQEFDGDIEL